MWRSRGTGWLKISGCFENGNFLFCGCKVGVMHGHQSHCLKKWCTMGTFDSKNYNIPYAGSVMDTSFFQPELLSGVSYKSDWSLFEKLWSSSKTELICTFAVAPLIFPQSVIKVMFCSRGCHMKVWLYCEIISGHMAKEHRSSLLEELLSFP